MALTQLRVLDEPHSVIGNRVLYGEHVAKQLCECAARLIKKVTRAQHERLEFAELRRAVELRAKAIDLFVFDVA